jgi:pyridoxal phosphate enzyme (YggS family)
VTSDEVAGRLAVVHERIRSAGGDVSEVTIVAVTKGQPVEAVHAALACGLVALGENYAQELVAKVPEAPSARWHFIGRLQRNKIRDLAAHVALWQSVDRPELVAPIARHAPGAAILVQVDPGADEGKGGCPLEAVPALVERATSAGLVVRGLMTVGPTDVGVDPRPGFAAVRALADRLGLDETSMGMSADLESAVSEGATMVRPGTALFGRRHVSRRTGN